MRFLHISCILTNPAHSAAMCGTLQVKIPPWPTHAAGWPSPRLAAGRCPFLGLSHSGLSSLCSLWQHLHPPPGPASGRNRLQSIIELQLHCVDSHWELPLHLSAQGIIHLELFDLKWACIASIEVRGMAGLRLRLNDVMRQTRELMDTE